MKRITAYYCLIIILCSGCSRIKVVDIQNSAQGQLKPGFYLREYGIKKIVLDSATSPRLVYMQYYDNEGLNTLAFLNKINNRIYIYDYNKGDHLKNISLDSLTKKKGSLLAFHIKNEDSIYVYDSYNSALLLTNNQGNLLNKVSLIGNSHPQKDPWFLKYPQYKLQTAIPFIETATELLVPGFFPFSVPSNVIKDRKLIAHVNYRTNKATFSHTYPDTLYGSNYSWGTPFTDVFTELMPDKKHLISSFSVSHDLYISDLSSSNISHVYAGSNVAGSISSFEKSLDKMPSHSIEKHFIETDEYAAIKYDKYRNVYYRFLRKGIPKQNENTVMDDKPVIVVIMDKNLKYLGETNIGKLENLNIQNVFVTREGLNVEYIGGRLNEDILTLKIFSLEKLNAAALSVQR